MNTYYLEPLAKLPLSTQLDRLHPDNYSGCMWADFIRTPEQMTNPENGDIYIFATIEQENEYKEQEEKRIEAEQEARKHKYDHVKTPFIDLYNSERWRNGLEIAKNQPYAVVEMCEDSFYHFMECVPPKIMEGKFYMCSEPYTHNSKGESVCIAGFEKNGRFYAQYGTVNDYRTKKMFLEFPTPAEL